MELTNKTVHFSYRLLGEFAPGGGVKTKASQPIETPERLVNNAYRGLLSPSPLHATARVGPGRATTLRDQWDRKKFVPVKTRTAW